MLINGTARRRIPLVQSLLKAVQCTVHAVSRQGIDFAGSGPVEKLGHVGRRDGVAAQCRLDTFETQGRKHQQPRNQRNEQPRHKSEVNTAKVSGRSQIVVVEDQSGPWLVGASQ